MLYHKQYGKGEDLVLLHGFAFHHRVWHNLVPQLSQHYTVHLIDLPGHGLSHATPMPTTLNECTAFFNDILPARAHIIGWSLGGLMATAFALRYPQRVHSLSLIGSTPCFLEKENWNGVRLDFFNKFYQRVTDNKENALRYFILLCLSDRLLQKKFYHEIVTILHQTILPSVETLCSSLQLLSQHDLREEINQLQCPYQYYMSHNDPFAPTNEMFPAITLPIVGHIPMITAPILLLKRMKILDEHE